MKPIMKVIFVGRWLNIVTLGVGGGEGLLYKKEVNAYCT